MIIKRYELINLINLMINENKEGLSIDTSKITSDKAYTSISKEFKLSITEADDLRLSVKFNSKFFNNGILDIYYNDINQKTMKEMGYENDFNGCIAYLIYFVSVHIISYEEKYLPYINMQRNKHTENVYLFEKCLDSHQNGLTIIISDQDINEQCDAHPRQIASYAGMYLPIHDTIYLNTTSLLSITDFGEIVFPEEGTILHEIMHRHKHKFQEFNDTLLDNKTEKFVPKDKRRVTKITHRGKELTFKIVDLKTRSVKELMKDYNMEEEEASYWIKKGLYNLTLSHFKETCSKINILANTLGRKVDKTFIKDFLYGKLNDDIPQDMKKDLGGVILTVDYLLENVSFLLAKCNQIVKAKKKEDSRSAIV